MLDPSCAYQDLGTVLLVWFRCWRAPAVLPRRRHSFAEKGPPGVRTSTLTLCTTVHARLLPRTCYYRTQLPAPTSLAVHLQQTPPATRCIIRPVITPDPIAAQAGSPRAPTVHGEQRTQRPATSETRIGLSAVQGCNSRAQNAGEAAAWRLDAPVTPHHAASAWVRGWTGCSAARVAYPARLPLQYPAQSSQKPQRAARPANSSSRSLHCRAPLPQQAIHR